MDNTNTSKQKRGHPHLSRLVLLLFLAGFQPAQSSDGEQPGPGDDNDNGEGIEVVITGPDYVTVGVPSSVGCEADCLNCTYSLSLDGQSAQGQDNSLAFTVNSWVDALTVTCTATLQHTKVTTTKQLRVLAGPANVTITGPDLMTQSTSHTYSCHAYCRPSCTYSWKTHTGLWIHGHSNVISVTPKESDSYKLLICKATNSVSGMFVAATRNVSIISGPSEIQIKGPHIILVGVRYKFVCTAKCLPSCRYVSSVDSVTQRGNVIELTVEQHLKSVTVKCQAQNTASRKTGTAMRAIQIKGSDHSLSTRAEETSPLLLLLMALMFSAAGLL